MTVDGAKLAGTAEQGKKVSVLSSAALDAMWRRNMTAGLFPTSTIILYSGKLLLDRTNLLNFVHFLFQSLKKKNLHLNCLNFEIWT